MRACVRRIVRSAAVAVAVAVLCQATQAAVLYDYGGKDVAPAAMEPVFGTKVARLDAKVYGFDFLFEGPGSDIFSGFRNLNVISEVFVAATEIQITPDGGSTITLPAGTRTFAYTLDYSQLDGFGGDSAIHGFQLLRTVLTPSVSNPGPAMALGEIILGGYNTNSAFDTPAMDAMTGDALEIPGMVSTQKVEYQWELDTIDPGTKAMVLMFASPDVQVWQVGWGSQDGQSVPTMAARVAIGPTGEGGSTVGGGQAIGDSIPVLIPVIPEPAALSLLAIGTLALARRRD